MKKEKMKKKEKEVKKLKVEKENIKVFLSFIIQLFLGFF